MNTYSEISIRAEIAMRQELIENVIRFVCLRYNIPQLSLMSKARPDNICWVRWIAFNLLRRQGFSLQSIGKAFGGKDHGTVLHGLRALDDRARTSRAHRKDVEEAISMFEKSVPDSIEVKFDWKGRPPAKFRWQRIEAPSA